MVKQVYRHLTEIRDLVAKNHTPGIQEKPEGGGLEAGVSKRPERAGVTSVGYVWILRHYNYLSNATGILKNYLKFIQIEEHTP